MNNIIKSEGGGGGFSPQSHPPGSNPAADVDGVLSKATKHLSHQGDTLYIPDE